MDEMKLKLAFSRIKSDMNFLKSEVEKLKSISCLNDEVKEEIEEIKKFDLRKVVKNLESEFSNLNFLIEKFNERLKTNSDKFLDFSSELENYNGELKQLREELMKLSDNSDSTKEELTSFEVQCQEFQELINEKINLELASLKLELESEIAKLDARISSNTISEKREGINDDFKKYFLEFQELINEKVTMEVSGLRLEFTDELAKIYDKCFSEILNLKTEIEKLKKEGKKTEVVVKKEENKKSLQSKKVDKNSKKSGDKKRKKVKSDSDEKLEKESKLKKVAKWLFVDEEEDFEDIKSEVKKGGKK